MVPSHVPQRGQKRAGASSAGAMTQERVPGHQKPPRGRTMAAATRFEKRNSWPPGPTGAVKGRKVNSSPWYR